MNVCETGDYHICQRFWAIHQELLGLRTNLGWMQHDINNLLRIISECKFIIHVLYPPMLKRQEW